MSEPDAAHFEFMVEQIQQDALTESSSSGVVWRERLMKMVELAWGTRWVSEESDYQHMVGIAAEIRSGNYETIDALKLPTPPTPIKP